MKREYVRIGLRQFAVDLGKIPRSRLRSRWKTLRGSEESIKFIRLIVDAADVRFSVKYKGEDLKLQQVPLPVDHPLPSTCGSIESKR